MPIIGSGSRTLTGQTSILILDSSQTVAELDALETRVDVVEAEVTNNSNVTTAATSTNTNNTIVKRDASGNFNAGIITATFNGNASTATTAATVTTIPTLSGEVSNVGNNITLSTAAVTSKPLTGLSIPGTRSAISASDSIITALAKHAAELDILEDRVDNVVIDISGLGNVRQGGNSFGTTMSIGTTDAQSLALQTAGAARATLTDTSLTLTVPISAPNIANWETSTINMLIGGAYQANQFRDVIFIKQGRLVTMILPETFSGVVTTNDQWLIIFPNDLDGHLLPTAYKPAESYIQPIVLQENRVGNTGDFVMGIISIEPTMGQIFIRRMTGTWPGTAVGFYGTTFSYLAAS